MKCTVKSVSITDKSSQSYSLSTEKETKARITTPNSRTQTGLETPH